MLVSQMPSLINNLVLLVVISAHSSHLEKLLSCSFLLYHRDLYHTYINFNDVKHP